MKIRITRETKAQMEADIKVAVTKRMTYALEQGRQYLFQEAGRLAGQVISSPEWSQLTGFLVGQFGFAQFEVDDIQEIVRFLVPNNKVTNLDVKVGGPGQQYVILNWCDYNELAFNNPFGLHELTKFDTKLKIHVVKQIVSWVDWWENGVTIRGYTFSDDINRDNWIFSRSHEGLMIPEAGGVWLYRPSYKLHDTANSYNHKELRKIIKKGVAAFIKR